MRKANKCSNRIRLARAMHAPPLSQEDLAAMMQVRSFNLSNNAISRIESGKRYVTDLELIEFSKILNVSTAWLLEETDDSRKRY